MLADRSAMPALDFEGLAFSVIWKTNRLSSSRRKHRYLSMHRWIKLLQGNASNVK